MLEKLEKAFVFAAGLGTRMRPITNEIPKPLVKIAGKTLLDYTLETLENGEIKQVVVNSHYKPEQIEKHLAARKSPLKITISYEPELLETGGGVIKMLDFFGEEPFITCNTDVIFLSRINPVLQLKETWNHPIKANLLVVDKTNSYGYDGAGDFDLKQNKLYKTIGKPRYSHVYTGMQIVTKNFLKNPPGRIFSLNHFYKINHQTDGGFANMQATEFAGKWLHIGTPEALQLERLLVE